MKKSRCILWVSLLLLVLTFCLVGCLDEPIAFVVSYQVDGVAYGDSSAITDYDELKLPMNPSPKSGFLFVGWYIDGNCWEIPYMSNYLRYNRINENIIVYAYFEVISFSVTYEMNGTCSVPRLITDHVDLNLPEDPVPPEKHLFGGWFIGKDIWGVSFTSEYLKTNNINDDITVYAYFKAISFTISYMANDSLYEENTITTVDYASVDLPTTNPIKLNYSFVGWFIDNNIWQVPFSSGYLETNNINEDTTVYAYFKKDSFTVSYMVDGVAYKTPSTINIVDYDILPLPPSLTKAGHTFLGWYIDNNIWDYAYTTEYLSENNINENIVVYARFEADLITIIKNVIGRNSDIVVTIDPASLAADDFKELTKTGYAFDGWYTDVALPAPFVFSTFKNNPVDITVYATFITNGLVFSPIDNNTKYSVTNFTGDNNVEVDIIIPRKFQGKPVTEIGEQAFYRKMGILSVIIPDTVTFIRLRAFKECEKLARVEIPNSVISIGSRAFKDTPLTGVTIPSSVLYIGHHAFEFCNFLAEVIIESSSIAEDPMASGDTSKLGLYASTLYIKEGLSITGSITSGFSKSASTDKSGHVKFTK